LLSRPAPYEARVLKVCRLSPLELGKQVPQADKNFSFSLARCALMQEFVKDFSSLGVED